MLLWIYIRHLTYNKLNRKVHTNIIFIIRDNFCYKLYKQHTLKQLNYCHTFLTRTFVNILIWHTRTLYIYPIVWQQITFTPLQLSVGCIEIISILVVYNMIKDSNWFTVTLIYVHMYVCRLTHVYVLYLMNACVWYLNVGKKNIWTWP